VGGEEDGRAARSEDFGSLRVMAGSSFGMTTAGRGRAIFMVQMRVKMLRVAEFGVESRLRPSIG
jgi:hypothetical protein